MEPEKGGLEDDVPDVPFQLGVCWVSFRFQLKFQGCKTLLLRLFVVRHWSKALLYDITIRVRCDATDTNAARGAQPN